MSTIMRLPKLGVNMTEATILSWKAKEGDFVTEGQTLFEAETDKAVQEFESSVTGVLERILAPAGATVMCQEPVASFRSPQQGGSVPAADSGVGQDRQLGGQKSAGLPESQVAPPPGKPAGQPGALRLRISPLARRTARSLGVDPNDLVPGKPGARVVRKDVLAWQAGRQAGAGTAGASIPLVGTRKTIAARMSQSARETARAALTIRVKASRLLEWREELKARDMPANISVLIAVLVGKALERFPMLNATLGEEAIHLHKDINVGIAVDSDRGLVVPVLGRVNRRRLPELMQEFQRQVAAVRDGSIAASDLANGTFTVTNLGAFGIESFTPIINPPQCAILALGAITREAVPAESGDALEICPVLRLTLAFDHRIVDGGPAARFLQHVKKLVEEAGADS